MQIPKQTKGKQKTSRFMKRKRTFSMDLADSILVERNSNVDGFTLVNPYIVGRRAPEDLVELAKEIQQADTAIKTSAMGKLQVIAEQMRFLQSQAIGILEEARNSQNLNHAHCNFKRIPGHIYHLYNRPSGQTYFSMLSPEEWGPSGPPHKHIGSFRLEHDKSWTPIENIPKKDKALLPLSKLVNGLDAIAYTSDCHVMEAE